MRLLQVLLFLLIPIVIVVIAIMQPFVDPRLLMLDPMVAAEESGTCCRTYYGLISTLGVLGWFSTAAICSFAAVLLRSLGGSAKAVLFASSAALLTAVLGFDDAFLFHENIAPKLGIGQNFVLGFYGLAAVFYILTASRILRMENLFLFFTAGFFLGASMGLDIIWHSTDSLVVSLEDGSKFIGIICWLGAHVSAMTELLENTVGKKRAQVPDKRMARAMNNINEQMVYS
ncbi:MAG: hypothetical protein ACR2O3_09015 [Rhizobiaceae bacterium]